LLLPNLSSDGSEVNCMWATYIGAYGADPSAGPCAACTGVYHKVVDGYEFRCADAEKAAANTVVHHAGEAVPCTGKKNKDSCSNLEMLTIEGSPSQVPVPVAGYCWNNICVPCRRVGQDCGNHNDNFMCQDKNDGSACAAVIK